MLRLLSLLFLLLLSPLVPAQTGPNGPLRVHIRAGVKTHGPGEHDHPRFLADWSVLLRERGAEVTGGMEFPTAAELEATDVLVMYAAEAASIHDEQREAFEAFLRRGGGLVVIHDAVCGDAHEYFQEIAGGAWEHGHSKWYEGEIGVYMKDREHPITRGASNFDFEDEIYWQIHLSDEAHVLAESFHTVFDVHPQMWVVERALDGGVPYRAFVSLQGHEYTSFSHLAWRALLLRGIAWAGGREADSLTTAEERAALRYPEGGPSAPAKADATFVPHEDFEVSLVAAEPIVRNPISIDWDERGRAWVACTPGYPFKEEFSGIEAHDRILILEDTDGDGAADRDTLFHEGLDLVTSLVPYRDGVIVTQAPEILWLRDTDGDDRCDEVVSLYSGFGYGDTHAVMSNLRWGMDGWIYGTQGYSGGSSRHIIGHGPHGDEDFGHIRNGLFRFRPDGSAIEMVSSYGANTWGLDFTWDGELFFTMANGAHLRHVALPESFLARGRAPGTRSYAEVPDHSKAFPISKHERPPYVQIDFVGGFTAAAGCLIYSGGAWPAEFDGNHFVCEPTLNIVHRDTLSPIGASFSGTKPREAEFLAAKDLWFRPVHLRTGPDGAMYVLDFYNQAAVHNDTRGPKHGPTNAAVRPDRDHLHGRIWRLQHRDALALPEADFASLDGLFAALAHPNRWARMRAQRLLAERDDSAAWIDRVVALATDLSVPPVARIHALWLCEALAPERHEILVPSLSDPDANVRKNAAWIVAARIASAPARGFSSGLLTQDPHAIAHELFDAETMASISAALLQQLQQPDERLRLAALAALSTLPSSDFIRSELIPLLSIPQEGWTRSALIANALVHPKSYLYHMVMVGEGAESAELVTLLTKEMVERFGTSEVLQIVGHLSTMSRARPPLVEVAVRSLVEASEKSDLPPWDDYIAEALHHLVTNDTLGVATASAPLVARLDTAGHLAKETEALGARLMGSLTSEDSSWDACLESLAILLKLPALRGEAIEASAWMLEPGQPLDMQKRAIAVFGACDDARAAATLIDSLRGLTNAARDEAFPWILRRPDWCLALLDTIAAGELTRIDLGPQRVFALTQHPDAKVAARAAEVLATGRQDKDALIAALLPRIEARGDAERGKRLFGEQCATCHTLNGEGAQVGPALDGMGAHGPAELLPFIVDPNRSVETNYIEFAARTYDGQTFSGVVVSDTADQLVLRGSAGEWTLERDEVEEVWSLGRSPMPEGLEELGADVLRDILTYVCAGYDDWRIVDLQGVATADTTTGLYDRREPTTYEFVKRGVVEVDGIPFEILNPAKAQSGKDAIGLKGAFWKEWESWTMRPQRVEVPVGYALNEMHVLGGVAAWGYPYTQDKAPAVRWTWVYADGESEEVTLYDGEHFADWIGRRDVPRSKYVEGLLRPRTRGQLRRFALRPSRPDVVVKSVVLESFENHLSPTFLALTARLGEPIEPPADLSPPAGSEPAEAAPVESEPIVLLGGGSSHDFESWFGAADLEVLGGLGLGDALFTADLGRLDERLADCRLLVVTNNQPFPADARAAVEAHAKAGKPLFLIHPSTWYNWADWPEWNRDFVGGGARSHEHYTEFEVVVKAPDHPLTAGLPATFRVEDELYRFEPDAAGAAIDVLAIGRSLETGAEYPVLWTVQHPDTKIVVTTLGHDGGSHLHAAYRRMLANAARLLLAK